MHAPAIYLNEALYADASSLRFQLASYLSSVRSYNVDQRRLGDLTTLDRAKSLLFSNVSHELIAPITLIAGPLDDVVADMTDGVKRESLVMARRNVSRLSRLVNMLLDISNLESGRLKGSFTHTNLGVLTRDVAVSLCSDDRPELTSQSLFVKTAAKAKIDFSIDCDVKERNVYVDRERWVSCAVTECC